jgi:hypothetical protein
MPLTWVCAGAPFTPPSIEAFSMLAYVWRRTRDTETGAARLLGVRAGPLLVLEYHDGPPVLPPAFDPHPTALIAALLPSRVAQAGRLDEERIADVVNV